MEFEQTRRRVGGLLNPLYNIRLYIAHVVPSPRETLAIGNWETVNAAVPDGRCACAHLIASGRQGVAVFPIQFFFFSSHVRARGSVIAASCRSSRVTLAGC
ncbi:hypothetical protein EVAR_12901_1 [Eumeta japonica]|uniref:Uncharacterized protein n=1 Tax=Eumeta variegata TaxID=151549 RepID=A0A4C1TVU0_EUMVA|nr:hypothetical protein EVAR_12901_1 [Eumeta japonica]